MRAFLSRKTEIERQAMAEDVRMLLNIGDNYLLNIDFSIQSCK